MFLQRTADSLGRVPVRCDAFASTLDGRQMLILYLVAASVALVWGTIVLRRGGLLGGCIVLMLLACCCGSDFYRFELGPVPLTIDRILLAILFVVYVALRASGAIRSPRVDWVDALFGGFLLMLAVSTLAHDWRVKEAQPLAKLVFLYLAPAVVYWLAREANIDERQLRMLYVFLGLFSVYLMITAIGEVEQISAIVFPRYIVTSKFQEWIGRARGPFLNPATNGMYLAAGLYAWMMFWPRASRIGKTLLLAVMGLVILGIYYTLTRSCWVGAFLGLACIVLALVPQSWRIPLAVTGSLLLSVTLAMKVNEFSSFKRDKNVSEFHMAESAQLRPMLAVVAWKIVRDYPLFGCGFGQYKQVDINYLHDPNINMPLEKVKPFVQHNVLFSLVSETGLLGMSLYMVLLGGWLYRAWHVWRDGDLPACVRQHGLLFVAFFLDWFFNGMFHDTNLMVNSNLLLFLLAGTSQGIYARAYLASRRQESSRPLPAVAGRRALFGDRRGA